MNLVVLKTPGFWAASVMAFLGVLLSQQVFSDGSSAAEVLGWIMAFLGVGGAGHQMGSKKQT